MTMKHLDVRTIPELLEIAEEVRSTNQPIVPTHHGKELAVVKPLKPRASALRQGFGAVTPVHRPEDWKAVRTEVEQLVAEEVAAEDETSPC